MASYSYKIEVMGFILVLVGAVLVQHHGVALGRRHLGMLREHGGTIKSVRTKDGDVVDCVDILKQPAFSNSHLKNHKMQMKPSSYPKGIELEALVAKTVHLWSSSSECPDGTIPIIRFPRAKHRAVYPGNKNPMGVLNVSHYEPPGNHEYAVVSGRSLDAADIHGAQANINVWNPPTMHGDFSLAQIWISSGRRDELNTIEAGWMVYPDKFGDNKTRLFIFYTTDGYATGCYNLECNGFVWVDPRVHLGGPIHPLSTYNGDQFYIDIKIVKENTTGNWWFYFENIAVGYWPNSLFNSLANGANRVDWGGEIFDSFEKGSLHTSTQMGSGHLPREGFAKASYISNLKYIDKNGTPRDPTALTKIVSNCGCYDIDVHMRKDSHFGVYFFFGGQGLSSTCVE